MSFRRPLSPSSPNPLWCLPCVIILDADYMDDFPLELLRERVSQGGRKLL